jgi:hypothetical protein
MVGNMDKSVENNREVSRLNILTSRNALTAVFWLSIILLAGCHTSPVTQDLIQGEGLVEIKYLDSMTVDVVDDVRVRRQDFYEDALENRKERYAQGLQGGIDRSSTLGVGVNVNAQRDKSLLERYQSASSQQISAIENSEELGESILEHEQQYLNQLNTLNQTRLDAQQNLINARSGAMDKLIQEYQRALSEIPDEILRLREEIVKYEVDKANAENNPSDGEASKVKAEAEAEIKQKGEQIKALELLRITYIGSLTTLANLDETELGQSAVRNSLTLATEETTAGAGDPKVTKTTQAILDSSPSQVSVDDNDTLKNALSNISELSDKIEELTGGTDSDNAITKTSKLQSPPVERIRNDEAVFDYLIDGYRNTKISSGAVYGGLVQRILPFIFTFTPGKKSSSGHSGRVVLTANDQELLAAKDLILSRHKWLTEDRHGAHTQSFIEGNFNQGIPINLLPNLLHVHWNPSCLGENIAISDSLRVSSIQKKLYDGTISSLKALKSEQVRLPSDQEFWFAYTKALNTIRVSILKSKGSLEIKESTAAIGYSLDISNEVISDINNLLDKIKAHIPPNNKNVFRTADSNSIYKRGTTFTSNWMRGARVSGCQLSTLIESLLNVNSLGTDIVTANAIIPNNKNLSESYIRDLKELLAKLENLVTISTSAVLTHHLYLMTNPLITAETPSIVIFPSGDSFNNSYAAEFETINNLELEKKIKFAGAPRIVQNSSREQVVEVADTSVINTLVDASIAANSVSSTLGANIGAEVAAAISSSSAFIKRIPYAIPINGPELRMFEAGGEVINKETFGWRYYKTPSGVTRTGKIVQNFKSTALNSAVVVSMPEWMRSIKATYEFAPNGSDWKTAGSQDIVLSGAGISGLLSARKHSFDEWVEYHLYKEVDPEAVYPALWVCGGKSEPISYIKAAHGQEIALCGEKLFGVKGISIGGIYIDDIRRVSNGLLRIRTEKLKGLACVEGVTNSCEVVALTDFGAVASEKSKNRIRLVWREDKTPSHNQPNLQDKSVVGRFTNVQAGANIEMKLYDYPRISLLTHYRTPFGIDTPITDPLKIPIKELKNVCRKNIANTCEIPISGFETNAGRVLLFTLDMDALNLWSPWKMPELAFKHQNTSTANKEHAFSLKVKDPNQDFPPLELSIGKGSHKVPLATNDGGYIYSADVSKTNIIKYCAGEETACSVQIRFKHWPLENSPLMLAPFKVN